MENFPSNSIGTPLGNPWTLDQIRIPASIIILLLGAVSFTEGRGNGERERWERSEKKINGKKGKSK